MAVTKSSPRTAAALIAYVEALFGSENCEMGAPCSTVSVEDGHPNRNDVYRTLIIGGPAEMIGDMFSALWGDIVQIWLSSPRGAKLYWRLREKVRIEDDYQDRMIRVRTRICVPNAYYDNVICRPPDPQYGTVMITECV